MFKSLKYLVLIDYWKFGKWSNMLLIQTWPLFFFSHGVLRVAYSTHVVNSELKSTLPWWGENHQLPGIKNPFLIPEWRLCLMQYLWLAAESSRSRIEFREICSHPEPEARLVWVTRTWRHRKVVWPIWRRGAQETWKKNQISTIISGTYTDALGQPNFYGRNLK